MSKQITSRSRAEKTRAMANTVVAPVSNDIVPGKYTDADLNLTIEQDGNEDYIFGIVETLLESVEKQIYETYLNSRVVPFTVDLAKRAMVRILEWEFLAHDMAEKPEIAKVWEEDKEPESCMIDSWAQGYFPKRQATMDLPTPSQHAESIAEESSKVGDSEEEVEDAQRYINGDIGLESESLKEEGEALLEFESGKLGITEESVSTEEKLQATQKQTMQKQRQSYKPYRGRIVYEGLGQLTETLLETEVRLEREQRLARLGSGTSGTQASIATPRGNQRVQPADFEGRVIQKLFSTSLKNCQTMRAGDILRHSNEHLLTLMRVPADQLTASQRVKANHRLVDAGPLRAALHAREATDTVPQMTNSRRASQPKGEGLRSPVHQGDKALPGSMIESIEPAPGVTVQEGDRVKKSVQKRPDISAQIEGELARLKPIHLAKTGPRSRLIDDIISAHRIQVKPLTSSPVPPIGSAMQLADN